MTAGCNATHAAWAPPIAAASSPSGTRDETAARRAKRACEGRSMEASCSRRGRSSSELTPEIHIDVDDVVAGELEVLGTLETRLPGKIGSVPDQRAVVVGAHVE